MNKHRSLFVSMVSVVILSLLILNMGSSYFFGKIYAKLKVVFDRILMRSILCLWAFPHYAFSFPYYAFSFPCVASSENRRRRMSLAYPLSACYV
jgi:hypothetical protein